MISEFKSELNVKNKFNLVIADLGKVETNPKIFQEIYEQIKDLDIGLLINNVGILKVK